MFSYVGVGQYMICCYRYVMPMIDYYSLAQSSETKGYTSSNNEGMPINRYDDTLYLYQPNICQSFYISYG